MKGSYIILNFIASVILSGMATLMLNSFYNQYKQTKINKKNTNVILYQILTWVTICVIWLAIIVQLTFSIYLIQLFFD